MSAGVVVISPEELAALIRGAVESALRLPTELLTVEQIAERLQTPKSNIYELSRQGRIPSHRVGRELRFAWPEVLRATQAEGFTRLPPAMREGKKLWQYTRRTPKRKGERKNGANLAKIKRLPRHYIQRP